MTDSQIQQGIGVALGSDLRVPARQIAVLVTDGVAALEGFVRSYAEKALAEQAALSVYGVRAIRNGIRVDVGRTDRTAAAAARPTERTRSGRHRRRARRLGPLVTLARY